MAGTLLVPLDGSPLAECALPYAETLASGLAGRIILLRATSGLPGSAPGYIKAIRKAESYLAAVASGISGTDVIETAVFSADPAQAIVEECRLRDIDLVVMATHGRSGLGRWLYGSVAAEVLRQCPVPVLLVHPGQGVSAAALARQPRLLVPLDGSPFAEQALPLAQRLADQLGGSIVLARVVPAPLNESRRAAQAGGATSPATDACQIAREYLRVVAGRIARDHAAQELDVRKGKPAEALARAAEERRVALVIMATHARQGIERLILGSVADGLLRSGTAPLLLVPPQTARTRS